MRLGIAVAAAALVALLVRSLEIGAPGERVPASGVGQHVADAQSIAYDQLPPTGGRHWPAPASWGLSSVAVPDERAVHNLEHGGIVVSYNAVTETDLARLRTLPATYPRDRQGRVKLLIRPYDRIAAGSIVLTAWGWRDTLGGYDDARVRSFLDAHMDRCCESVP